MDWAKNEEKKGEKYKNKAENKNAIESRKREKEKLCINCRTSDIVAIL